MSCIYCESPKRLPVINDILANNLTVMIFYDRDEEVHVISVDDKNCKFDIPIYHCPICGREL